LRLNENRMEDNRAFPFKKLSMISFFITFNLLFFFVSFSLLVFYGPFENVKRTVVGMSWSSLRHQYIARLFLSDMAIQRILGDSFAVDPTAQGEEIEVIKFNAEHSDRIELYNIKGNNFKGKMLLVHDPKRIVVGWSSLIPKAGETTSAIAKRNGAVAAINAGGFMDRSWTGTGGLPMGFVIHDSKVIYNHGNDENVRMDTAAFTREGMLIVGKHSIAQLKEYGVKEAVSFGPPLIVNGRPTIKNGDGGWGIAPRTAIGQRKDGTVILLVIDGRDVFHSLGATLRDVQDILLEYGAVNAVNLDGGSSTTMYFNGKVINKPSDVLGERAVPTVFMVMPEEDGAGK